MDLNELEDLSRLPVRRIMNVRRWTKKYQRLTSLLKEEEEEEEKEEE
jgi:hypothetical protein